MNQTHQQFFNFILVNYKCINKVLQVFFCAFVKCVFVKWLLFEKKPVKSALFVFKLTKYIHIVDKNTILKMYVDNLK